MKTTKLLMIGTTPIAIGVGYTLTHSLKYKYRFDQFENQINHYLIFIALSLVGLLMLGCLLHLAWDEWQNAQNRTQLNTGFIGRYVAKSFLSACVVFAVCFGGAKPSGSSGENDRSQPPAPEASSPRRTMRDENSSMVTVAGQDLLPGDICGEIMFPTNALTPTNLSFFGIVPTPSNVWLGATWPMALNFTNSVVDLYSSETLSQTGWVYRTSVDVSSIASNVVLKLDDGCDASRLTNRIASTQFYRLATADDSDGDGLTDAEEKWVYGTNPLSSDSDEDGFDDGFEIAYGRNPCVNDAWLIPDSAFSAGLTLSYGYYDYQFDGRAALRGSSSARQSGHDDDEPSGSRASGGSRGESDWPNFTLEGGLPQLPRDDSHDNHTFVFSKSISWHFRPYVTGDYTYSIAADDSASLSVGNSSLSVTWPEDHGQLRSMVVHLVAGEDYTFSLGFSNSGGGAYFLTTQAEYPSTGTSPRLVLNRRTCVINPWDPANPVISQITCSVEGDLKPYAEYEVRQSNTGGLTGSSNEETETMSVSPVGSDYWLTHDRSVVTFRLYENGAPVDSKDGLFIVRWDD